MIIYNKSLIIIIIIDLNRKLFFTILKLKLQMKENGKEAVLYIIVASYLVLTIFTIIFLFYNVKVFLHSFSFSLSK